MMMIVTIHHIGLLIATLGGTAVGLERQWSGHADGPGARFGGIRTFTMLGAVSGLIGLLLTRGEPLAAIALLAGATAIIVAAYVAASRHDVDATTEVAALVVVAAGVFAGLGSVRLASGIIALLSLLLVEKSRLHSMVARIDDVSLRAAVRFGVMALVVLPLLPSGPYGPLGGVRPRELWALVLFFSGLSFVGFVARRIVGPSRGYFATGLIGGLISSTNVTFTFARASRPHPEIGRELAFGAVAANAMLFPRVLIARAALNPPLVLLLVPYFLGPAIIALAVAALGARRRSGVESDQASSRKSAPALRSATYGCAVPNCVDGGASGQPAVGRRGRSDHRRAPGPDRCRCPDDVDGAGHFRRSLARGGCSGHCGRCRRKHCAEIGIGRRPRRRLVSHHRWWNALRDVRGRRCVARSVMPL